MDPGAGSGWNTIPGINTRFSLSMENEQADMGRDGPNPSREIKSSGANGDRAMFIFPVQLTTSRNGNLTRLIHTLLCMVITYTCMDQFMRSSLFPHPLLA